MIRERQPALNDEHWQAAPAAYTVAPAKDNPPAESDSALAELQDLLFSQYRERLGDLRLHMEALQEALATVEQEVAELNDIERLAAKIQPSLAPAISASIRDSRDVMVEALAPIIDRLITTSIHDSRDSMVEALLPIVDRLINTSVRESSDNMVDALYPIIGRLVSRSVSEALRDLVRRIDEQMRSALDIKVLARRAQARLAGVPDAEFALRFALPFQVLQIFLIHHETGLLLHSVTQDPELAADSDIISGMLTAIRDFAEDAIGHGVEGDLDEVQYGDKRILIESARYIYIAVVTKGVAPQGYRTDVRECLLDIEHAHASRLRDYSGDSTPFAAARPLLEPLLLRGSERLGVAKSPSALHAVPLVRRTDNLQLAPAVRLTFALGIVTLLLSIWHVWNFWFLQPTVMSILHGFWG